MEEFCDCVSTDDEVIKAIEELNSVEKYSQPWMYGRYQLSLLLLQYPGESFVYKGTRYWMDYDGDLNITRETKSVQ